MIEDTNLIKALGIQNLPDEQKAAILERSTQLIEQRLLLRLIEALSEDKRAQLNLVLDRNNKDELNEFIAHEAPNFLDWIEDEVAQLRDELHSLGEIED